MDYLNIKDDRIIAAFRLYWMYREGQIKYKSLKGKIRSLRSPKGSEYLTRKRNMYRFKGKFYVGETLYYIIGSLSNFRHILRCISNLEQLEEFVNLYFADSKKAHRQYLVKEFIRQVLDFIDIHNSITVNSWLSGGISDCEVEYSEDIKSYYKLFRNSSPSKEIDEYVSEYVSYCCSDCDGPYSEALYRSVRDQIDRHVRETKSEYLV